MGEHSQAVDVDPQELKRLRRCGIPLPAYRRPLSLSRALFLSYWRWFLLILRNQIKLFRPLS